MTLVAAYRPEGIPVLLGDFLITGVAVESTGKKIHRVGPNFVIGWTGRRILAAPILHALIEKFRDERVLITDVEEFLNFATMEYALMACADARVQIYEKGLAVGPLNEEYRANDTFTISEEEVNSVDTVRYYVNSKRVYQSLTAPTFPLRGAVCLREDGASLSESKLFGNWVQAAAV